MTAALAERAALVLAATDAAQAATEVGDMAAMRIALGVLRDAATLTRVLNDGAPPADTAAAINEAQALAGRLARDLAELDAQQRTARLEDGEG